MPDNANPVPPKPSEALAPGAAPPHKPMEITLQPRRTTTTAAAPKPADTGKPAESKDSLREVIETVVFVVVLVLLLKTFLAEAFVIPTGSMAETLLGYNREVTCGETNAKGELVKGCGYHFLVNASKEGDPGEVRRTSLSGCKCPNCGYVNKLQVFRFERPGGVVPDGGNP
jgi:hypothetical protein